MFWCEVKALPARNQRFVAPLVHADESIWMEKSLGP
jgi:hypothetical protein